MRYMRYMRYMRKRISSAITDPQNRSTGYKTFHLRDQERKSLGVDTGNKAGYIVDDPLTNSLQHIGTVRGSKGNVKDAPYDPRKSSVLLQAAATYTGDNGDSSGLRAALERKAIDRTLREAMYEEKRLRYLAGVKRENTPNGSNVQLRGHGVEGTRSSMASLTSASERQEEICAPQKQTGSEQNRRRLETGHSLKLAGNNSSELGTVMRAQDNGRGNGRNGRNQPEEQAAMVGNQRMSVTTGENSSRPMSKQATRQNRAAHANVEYAGQLREKMTADRVAALRGAKKDAHHSVPGSIEGSPRTNLMEDRIGSERGSTGVACTAGDPERKEFDNSKAKYARQLREQIVANETARRAVNSEREKNAAAASAIPGTSGGRNAVDQTVRAKEEYALKLREQIASKRADKCVEGQGDNHNPTANDGPAWLESATEGRERRRRVLKAEYAEQLRAQIAQRAGVQRLLKSESHMPEEEIAGGRRLSRNGGKGIGGGLKYGGQEVRRRHIPPDESQVFDRQKRAEHQQKYAEALRRDMVEPKTNSLGRPIEDITRPTKTRREYLENNNNWLSPHHLVSELNQQQRQHESPVQPHHPSRRQYSSRRSECSPHQPQVKDNQHCGWYSEDERTLRTESDGPRRDPHAIADPFRYKNALGGADRTAGLNRVQGRDGIKCSTGRDDVQLQFAKAKRPHIEEDPRMSWEQSNLLQQRPQVLSRHAGNNWGANAAKELVHGDSDWRGRAGARIDTREIAKEESRCQGWQAPQHMKQIGDDNITIWPGIDLGDDNPELQRETLPSIAQRQPYECFKNWGLRGGAFPEEKYQSYVPQNGMSTRRARNMHNPIDFAEVARMKAKKDAYRRDLEAQIAEHKQQKGKHGSKDTEIILLEEAMAKRNKINEKAPGYEIGPLGIAVMKESCRSKTLGEPRVPPSEVRSTTPASPSHPVRSKQANALADGLLPTTTGGDEGEVVVPIRGSGLRDLLGLKGDDTEKERSRLQAEALNNQVKDNNARREKENALLLEEEVRIQKERKQLRDRHTGEERAKVKKVIESERFIKEAGEARQALMARKEAEATRMQQLEKQENARVERERKELEKKYAEERMAETPLNFGESSPALQARTEPANNPRKISISPARTTTPCEEKAVSVLHSSPEEHTTRAHDYCTSRSTVAPTPNPKTPPHGSSGNDHAATLEKLQTELWKQRQLTELLRREVGQQEAEKRKLLEVARCARKSEATVPRESYKRLSSQRVDKKNRKGQAGLWSVPPPPLHESGVNDYEATSNPGNGDKKNEDRQQVESTTKLPVLVMSKSEMDETEEDRLLLAGLRRIGTDRNAHGGSSSAEIKADGPTFQDQAPVDKTWSDRNPTNRGVEGSENPGDHQSRRHNGLPADRIRAESWFVFPDGSIRWALSTGRNNGEDTPDRSAEGNPCLPMTLVGTSRVDSAADLSTALVVSVGDGGRTHRKNTRRHLRNEKMRGRQGETYRTLPGRAPDTAHWASDIGRPPRPYVPFLNLPALEGKNDRRSQRRQTQELRRKEPHTHDQTSILPSKLKVTRRQREMPATSETGYRRPLRTATGTSRSSSSRTSRNGNSEEARGQQRRRAKRRGLNHSGDGYSPYDDGEDNTGSDSTDMEFLRRRAEAKLRPLKRREAAAKRAGEDDLEQLVTASEQSLENGRSAKAAMRSFPPSSPAIGRGVPNIKYSSNASCSRHIWSATTDESQLYSSSKNRPATKQSVGSLLG